MPKDRRQWEEAGIPAPIPAATRRRIEELARTGRSIDGIARELGIGYGTAWNHVRAARRA